MMIWDPEQERRAGEALRLRDFSQHLAARGYAPRTADAYRWMAQTFLRWSAGRTLNGETMERYRQALRRGYARGTVRANLAAVRAWFSYLEAAGHAKDLPPVPKPLSILESRQGQRPGTDA
jgi:site-specific recombinase XerD